MESDGQGKQTSSILQRVFPTQNPWYSIIFQYYHTSGSPNQMESLYPLSWENVIFLQCILKLHHWSPLIDRGFQRMPTWDLRTIMMNLRNLSVNLALSPMSWMLLTQNSLAESISSMIFVVGNFFSTSNTHRWKKCFDGLFERDSVSFPSMTTCPESYQQRLHN